MSPSGVSVIVPVKDGERYLEELLAGLSAQGEDLEILVIDSGSRGPLAGDRPGGRRRAARDPGRRLRPRADAQPRRRAHDRRADLLPHPGRDPPPGLAGRLPGGLRAGRPRRGRLRPPPGPAGYEPDDRARAGRVLRRLRGRAGRPARRGSDLPLQRERLLRPGLLGRAPLPRAPLQRGPGVRRRSPGRRLGQGLPPGGRRPPRPRLRGERLHAPLLRRVPGPARVDRAHRADRPALGRSGGPAPGRGRHPLDGRTRLRPGRSGALGGPGGRPPRRAEGLLGARIPRRAAAPGAPAPALARAAGGRAAAAPPARPRARARPGRRGRAGPAPEGGPRVRLDLAPPARRTRPPARPGARHGRPGVPAPGVRDPAVRDRLGRPQHRLPARRPARAARAHLLDLGLRSVRRAGERVAGGGAPDDHRELRADPGTPPQGVRALAGRRRRGGDRVADGLQRARAARGPGPGLPDQRPRARVLRDLGRVPLGRADLWPGALRDLREPVAARALRDALRRASGAPSSTGSTTRSTARSGGRAGRTRSSSTPAR